MLSFTLLCAFQGEVEIQSIVPASGPVYGGTEIQLQGVGLVHGGHHILCAMRMLRTGQQAGMAMDIATCEKLLARDEKMSPHCVHC